MRFAVFELMTDRPETIIAEKETDQLTKLLEIELAQKRATWKHSSERARSDRAAGFVFLFVLIVGCLVAGYFAFMQVNERRANGAPQTTAQQ